MGDMEVPSYEQLRVDVEHMKDWIAKEPHLPNIEDEYWLRQFLYHNKFRLKKAKRKLERYYTFRSKYPEVMKDRDPTSAEIARLRRCCKLAMAPKPTKDGSLVYFLCFQPNAQDLDITVFTKFLFMVADLWLLLGHSWRNTSVYVVDFKDFRYLHALKMMYGSVRLAEIFLGAYTERYKGIHCINVPKLALKPIEIMKKFFPVKLRERVYIHASSDTLIALLGEDVVCREFGGSGPSFDELEEQTYQELVKQKKWFEEQNGISSDESLRRIDFGRPDEMSGSFRKLEFD